jgi:phosphate transport system permease protein
VTQRLMETGVLVLSWAMALILFSSVLVFVAYLLVKGVPSLGIELVFGDADPLEALTGRARVFDGIYPAIVGTICLVLLSTALAAPAGICAGVYLAEYASPPARKLLGLFFDILAGIPSIVIGLFGFSVAVFLHHRFGGRIGPSLVISAGSLAFLVLPYIIRSTQASLEGLPAPIRRTAPALGATRLQNIGYVLLPRALPGITSGVILAVGRCAEDTAVILLTGVVAAAGVPSSLLSQYEALPFYIYYISGQYADAAELSRGYGACLILLGICAALFIAAYAVQNRLAWRTLYRA